MYLSRILFRADGKGEINIMHISLQNCPLVIFKKPLTMFSSCSLKIATFFQQYNKRLSVSRTNQHSLPIS